METTDLWSVKLAHRNASERAFKNRKNESPHARRFGRLQYVEMSELYTLKAK